MNYRHAFHAGNFADCMKHALLVWMLGALARKPAALFALDTHAGLRRHDLALGPASRTGEWQAGIARLLDAPPPAPLAEYVALVQRLGLYPGSPAIIQAMLRADDRLACCELHPEDAATLRHSFRHDRQVAVHHRDGYEAIGALLPPAQKRGIVLIDPPYEAPCEFERVGAALRQAQARCPAATLAAWYPIKHRAPVRGLHLDLQSGGLRDVVAAELWLREPLDAARLNGCGLAVVNPPYQFEPAARDILAALLSRLGSGEAGEGHAVTRLVAE